ncbi:hypothetical protein Q9X96_003451 [Vibrio vulnificus]|nr:hypothetical protein [Vibrio vulnificus]
MPKMSRAQAAINLDNACKRKGYELLTPYVASKQLVTIRCSRGHITQQTPTNITNTDQGCCHCATNKYHTDRAGIFYCVRWRHPVSNHSFLKFGITSRQDHLKRIVQQSKETDYLPEDDVVVRWFIDGSTPPAIERVIHDNLKTSYVSKAEFGNGFTETVADNEENIAFIKSMVWG